MAESIANHSMVETPLYDASGHQSGVAAQAGPVSTDPSTGRKYAPEAVQDVNIAWTSVYSATLTGVNSWAGSGDISGMATYSQLAININVTAITGTSIQIKVARKDVFGNWITLVTGAAITAVGSQALSIGGGGANNAQFFGSDVQVTCVFNTITSVTFTVDVEAR